MLLQHRALWSHVGGTWALPGGARDSHETPAQAALREAWEETGIVPSLPQVTAEVVTAVEPSGWTYTTVIARVPSCLTTRRNAESAELRWVPETAVAALRLHPGFASAWPGLRELL